MKKMLAVAAIGSLALGIPSTQALAGTSAAGGAKLSSTPSQSIQASSPSEGTRGGCGYNGMTRPRLVLQPDTQTVRRGHGTALKARLSCNGRRPIPGRQVRLHISSGNGNCSVTNAQGASFCRVSRRYQDSTAYVTSGRSRSNTVTILVS